MNRILIIDDSDDLLEPLKIFLEQKNYIVETLTRAVNIFQEISRYKPDLILLDVFISGEDGRNICKMLKDNAETKQVGIIMFSASSESLYDYKSYDADDFIEKPFDLHDLDKKIRALLEIITIRNKAM